MHETLPSAPVRLSISSRLRRPQLPLDVLCGGLGATLVVLGLRSATVRGYGRPRERR